MERKRYSTRSFNPAQCRAVWCPLNYGWVWKLKLVGNSFRNCWQCWYTLIQSVVAEGAGKRKTKRDSSSMQTVLGKSQTEERKKPHLNPSVLNLGAWMRLLGKAKTKLIDKGWGEAWQVIWSDVSLCGRDHTFLLLPLWWCSPRLSRCFGPSCFKDNSEEGKQNENHTDTVSDGAAGSERTEQDGKQRVGRRGKEGSRPVLTSKTSEHFHLKKNLTSIFQNLLKGRLSSG